MTSGRTVHALAPLVFVLASCSSAPDPPNAQDVRPTLAPRLETATVDVGQPAPLVQRSQTIGTFTVSKFEVGGDGRGPWLLAVVRIENKSSREAVFPAFGIKCKGSAEPGMPLTGDWTREVVPAGRSSEEKVPLAVPGDQRAGSTVPKCEPPAFAEFAAIGDTEERDPVSRIRIPDDLIAELNAKRVR
jgi:hypothetical protein